MTDPTPEEHPDSPADSAAAESLAHTIRASAHQIWLAGLGAFAKTQQEGGKVFEALVKEGSQLKDKAQVPFEALASKADELAGKAGAPWDKLESVFEARSSQVMQRMGLPTAQEVADLRAQVAALAEQVRALQPPAPPARKRVARKRARAKAKSVTPAAEAADGPERPPL